MGNSNSGRKSKDADQKMIESLSVYQDDVYRILHENILKGESWAIRIWFDRVHGKPTEQKSLEVTNHEVPLFNINYTTVDE